MELNDNIQRRKSSKINYVLISSLVATIILYIIEQQLMVDYFIKTASKLLLFIVIPCFFIKYVKHDTIKKSLSLKRDQNIKLGFLLGFCSFSVLIIAYIIFKQYIDFNSIIAEMQNKSKITANNFIMVGLYVTLVNSFLEEFFFRGFIFLNLYELGKVNFAYIYFSLLFALYHIAIFKTWFNLPLTLLALLGLFVIGLIFNFVDTKSHNLLNSWIIHIFANVAIILIGLRLFAIV